MRRSLRSLIDAMDFAGNLVEGTNHLYRDHNLENTGFNNCYSSFSTINYQSMKSHIYRYAYPKNRLFVGLLASVCCLFQVFAWLTVLLSGNLPIYVPVVYANFVSHFTVMFTSNSIFSANEPENPEKMVVYIKLNSDHVQM